MLDAVQGGVRRFTGSRWLPDGGIPPPTTFYGEGTPVVDLGLVAPARGGRVASPLELDLPGARRRSGRPTATPSSTARRAGRMRTPWRGTPFAAVLDAAGADPAAPLVRIRSVTGWSVSLERDELDDAILATHVAGLHCRQPTERRAASSRPSAAGSTGSSGSTSIEVA